MERLPNLVTCPQCRRGYNPSARTKNCPHVPITDEISPIPEQRESKGEVPADVPPAAPEQSPPM